jgi:cell division protein FtsW (lipid II flippase)
MKTCLFVILSILFSFAYIKWNYIIFIVLAVIFGIIAFVYLIKTIKEVKKWKKSLKRARELLQSEN